MAEPILEEIDSIEWVPPQMSPEMPDWLHYCPRCDSDRIMPELRVEAPFGLRCDDCGRTDPPEGWDEDSDAAIWAWE